MENKNIIILLILIIVVIASVISLMILSPFESKQDIKITIISNDTLYENDNLTVKLTDINGTGISGESINITITDDAGGSYTSVITDSSGVGVLNLDKSTGNYTVNCTYGGNDKYAGNTTTQKLEIIEEIIEQPVVQQSISSYSSNSYSGQNDNRPSVDSGGITREEADYWGWEYTTEHGGHYIGSHDYWDENAGMYHD